MGGGGVRFVQEWLYLTIFSSTGARFKLTCTFKGGQLRSKKTSVDYVTSANIFSAGLLPNADQT